FYWYMSKKSLFIIVHEQEVKDEASYLASSIKALREIKNIKSFMEEKWQQASEQNHSEPSHQKPQ
ncbi:hypothetical protein LCGC14_3115600, partial [marine sediment metagenome]